jgi:hypothetical protein
MMRLGKVGNRRAWSGLGLAMAVVWGLSWTRPAPLVVGDQVTVPASLPGTADAVVLARGGVQTGTCLYDRLRKGRGTLEIGQLTPNAACKSDVLLFAQGSAMSDTPRNWTTGSDAVTLPEPPPRVIVGYSMVLVAKGGTSAQQAGSDTVQAIRRFDQNRSGITFQASRIVRPRDLTPGDIQTIGQPCDPAALANLATKPKLYDPNHLNVYFLPGSLSWRGWTCFREGFPKVIYVSIAGDSPGTLAHEFGHALGLQDWPGNKAGHTGAVGTARIQGFMYPNLMWTGLNDLQASEQWHFSIGQDYRMNMDDQSWMITGHLVQGRIGLDCHPTVPEDSMPCPFLARDTVPS